MALLTKLAGRIQELEAERERIKQRRQDELDALDRQLVPLKKAHKRVQGDPELDVLLADLVSGGFDLSKE